MSFSSTSPVSGTVPALPQTAEVETNQAVVQTRPAPRLRLEFLDGLGGWAAFLVLLYHLQLEGASPSLYADFPAALKYPLRILSAGHYIVGVFIVLSGYCLMLPVARSVDGQLKGGVGEYLKRRARRILPPYYAALALTLIAVAALPILQAPGKTFWLNAFPMFQPASLLSHLTLTHNLSVRYLNTINPPFWSVAAEWDIYFIFPFLLLPIWRRFGNAGAIVGAFALGYAPHFLKRGAPWDVWWTCPWYIALFALGMGAAAIEFTPHRSRLAETLRNGAHHIAAATFALFFVAVFLAPNQVERNWSVFDPLIGIATASLLIACARTVTTPTSSSRLAERVRRLLEARSSAKLGMFSYSLYLMHTPLLVLLHRVLLRSGLSDSMVLATLYIAGIPLILSLVYLFHLAFEHRFMSRS